MTMAGTVHYNLGSVRSIKLYNLVVPVAIFLRQKYTPQIEPTEDERA